MASFFNGFTGFFFGGRAAVPEASIDAHSESSEEQPSSPAQSSPQQDSTPSQHSSSSGHSSTSRPAPMPATGNPPQPTEDARGPPPSYRSGDFFSQLPDDESDDGRLPAGLTPLEQRCSVLLMHRNSLPEHRFKGQVEREETRLAEKWAACNLKREHWLEGHALTELATDIVQRRWTEQGIAKEGVWFCGPLTGPSGFWKHQEIRPDHVPKDVRRLDASRPFFQFMHDVAMERDHLEFLAYPPLLCPEVITRAPEVNHEPTPDDLHTTAYYNVRYEQWVARGIWDYNWGALPGMYWKHETDIRVLFEENFGSTEGIPQSHLEMSDLLPNQLSFRGQRIDTLTHFPAAVERALREWTTAASPSASTQGGQDMDDHSPSPAPRRVAGRTRAPANSLFGESSTRSPKHASVVPGAGAGQDLRDRTYAVPEGGLFGEAPRRSLFEDAADGHGFYGGTVEARMGAPGHAQVESQRAMPQSSLFGGTAEPRRGLFGQVLAENQPVLSQSSLFGGTAPSGQGLFAYAQAENQRASPQDSLFGGAAPPGQGLFGRAQAEAQQEPPRDSLFGSHPAGGLFRETPEPRQGAAAGDGVARPVQPGPSAGRAPVSSLFGVLAQMPSIREESVASEETSSSAYGDENEEEDPLDAVQRQFLALQRSTEQVLSAHRALGAQLSSAVQRRSSARREPTRGAFSGETHQRRVLGPLPSSQRVSKPARGATSVMRSVESPESRASSATSEAATVIWNPQRSPSPAKHGISAETSGSSHQAGSSFATGEGSARDEEGSVAGGDDMPWGNEDFVIREDSMEVEEDVPMEEPRTGPTPRARAKRQRWESAERSDSRPLRRSKRRTAAR